MIKKLFFSSKCRVEFSLPAGITQDEDTVHLVGDFNQWDTKATTLKPTWDHRFTVSLDLPLDRKYQYRYLINGHRWYVEPDADGYARNPFLRTNALVSTFRPKKAIA